MTRPQSAEAPEVRRAQAGTWVALVVVPVGIAALLFLYGDLDPAVHGLFAVVAALEVMIALSWWRSHRRRDER
ncbi:hypothetical protein [Blastococcus brunescens]|uniref:Uncharacterized protein n=1 Tax=Blastococcus brunescens TaxID=1564165 RepID=A0ABZ1BAD8_9ACTN|nr:hypothetical protein [Blastococcus sp. BMG 8361]WRL66160.1 hypothetical protein U6N30_12075 [Blastococcus sp. BMG 8361]